jgi:hypothetical protein
MAGVWDVEDAVSTGAQAIDYVCIRRDGLQLVLKLQGSPTEVCIDLRTALHIAHALDLPTRVDDTRLAVDKSGQYTGVHLSASGNWCHAVSRGTTDVVGRDPPAAWTAAAERARAAALKKAQRKRAREHGRAEAPAHERGHDGDDAGADDRPDSEDVECVGERTREERDAEGRANAVDLDA